jgi:general stress protein CsbA
MLLLLLFVYKVDYSSWVMMMMMMMVVPAAAAVGHRPPDHHVHVVDVVHYLAYKSWPTLPCKHSSSS